MQELVRPSLRGGGQGRAAATLFSEGFFLPAFYLPAYYARRFGGGAAFTNHAHCDVRVVELSDRVTRHVYVLGGSRGLLLPVGSGLRGGLGIVSPLSSKRCFRLPLGKPVH